jgi:predicted lactoylglutathione lyase
MSRMIFVNLPVTDLARSIAFYEAAGASQNPKFSDDKTMCMVFSDTIFVMLLTHEKFAQFTQRRIADAHATVQTLLCLSADSRDHVDRIVETAASSGGRPDPNAAQDYGFMYGRSVEDPDGHIWEIMWMDPVAAEKGPEAIEARTA